MPAMHIKQVSLRPALLLTIVALQLALAVLWAMTRSSPLASPMEFDAVTAPVWEIKWS
jgi:hypothetical protein